MSDVPAKKKSMLPPISAVFRFVQTKTRIRVWLHDSSNLYIDGVLIGCDEFMNLVLDNAAEVQIKKGTSKNIGRILLKGDNITMLTSAPTA